MDINHNQETFICPAQEEAIRWMEQHPEVFGPRGTKEETLSELNHYRLKPVGSVCC